jgi:copper chaperone CopZ
MRAQRLRIPIYGLGCGGGGAANVEHALTRAPGVLRVYVNPATEVAYVDVDPTRTDAGRLVWAIHQAGYRAGPAVEA